MRDTCYHLGRGHILTITPFKVVLLYTSKKNTDVHVNSLKILNLHICSPVCGIHTHTFNKSELMLFPVN